MTVPPLVNEWLQKAEDDYREALMVARRQNPSPDIACFHAQQAAEKYLKGYLAFHGVEFRRSHDLIELKDLCRTVDPQFQQISQELHDLNPFSVEVRYPGASASVSDIPAAIASVKVVRRFIRRRLNLL